MAKSAAQKTHFVCQECGYDTVKWLGRCPGCGVWGAFVEERVGGADDGKTVKRRGGLSLGLDKDAANKSSGPQPIVQITTEESPRLLTGSSELDRVLGGGVVAGSVVLIAGDPGVGKSTLTLRLASEIAKTGRNVLYVTGEESARQVKIRADRLGALAEKLYVVSETNLETIVAHCEKIRPSAVVIDSIQTVYLPDVTSAPGSVSQVRECSVELLRLAKSQDIALFIVGHATKDGNLAGPRVLEHIVDTVLFFEGEKNIGYRILRTIKNRFGSTNEIGLFEMQGNGLVDVPDASKLFLSDRLDATGSVVVPALEGTRPLLVEIQALVAKTPYVPPRRISDAIDIKRLTLLIAVLEKRARLALGTCDVFVKAAGGLNIDEPAADLGLAVAVASSLTGAKPLPKTVVIGEVGLSGEIRAVTNIEKRLKEAARLGFRSAVLPQKNTARLTEKEPYGIKIISVGKISDALSAVLQN